MRVFALLLMLAGVSSSAWATAYLKGTFNNWGETNAFSNGVCKVCLGANTTYEFKVNDGSWYGADGTMESTNCANWILYENTGNTKIKTTKSGEYTFNWDSSSKKLSVTYPTTESSCSGSSTSSGNLKEPYVISVYKDGQSGQRFEFTPVSGSKNYEYEVHIEITDYSGNPKDYKYWVGEKGEWKEGQSANYNLGSQNKAADDFVATCATGAFHAKIYALQENGQPHGEACNYYIHSMSCSEHSAKISLSSSVREFDLATPPESITLTATADDKSEGNYIWYKSEDEGVTYTKITETTTNTYTLSGANVPTGERNYYKVARKVVGTTDDVEAIVVIYTVQSCGAESKGLNIFRQDFGELTAVRDNGSRKNFSNIVSGYTYQPAPYKINDGYYAVVADPYYCGCGEGSNMDEKVTDDCLKSGVWFRELRDHTLMNNGATGPYGGMLMINFKGNGIAYQRELTATEQASITKNSILKFSAYFASAAVQSKQDVTFNPINMELKIQFQKTGTTTWQDAVAVTSQVKYEEGWQRGEVEWVVDEVDGKFRVVINNLGADGDGNDLLMDDVSLDLCTPAFTLYFVDDKGAQTETIVAKNVSDQAEIQVKQIDFGSLGEDPCMQLYKRVTDGTNTSYTYVSDLTLSRGYYKTNVSIESLFTQLPGSVELVAVASAKDHTDCDASVKPGVEDGTFTPGAQNNVIFSGNYLTYSLDCGTSILSLATGEDTNICYTTDMILPKLKLTSTNITTSVKMDILVDDTAILTDIPYAQDINISELCKAKNGEDYLPAIGERKITVKVREYFNGAVVCERLANGVVTINVMGKSDIPVTNRYPEVYAYNMCKTEGDDPAINDDKFFFNDLITSPADKSGLVWLTMDDKLIDSDSLFFYADKVQDKSVKVYNNPAGSCPSEPIIVRYRVKEITKFTEVGTYKECPIEGDSIPLSNYVKGEKEFKYLFFKDESNQDVKKFDPSVSGVTTYTVKASYDEINSLGNNYCEADTTITITIKEYATAANIIAKDTTVCPEEELILIAKPNFTGEQTNVKLTWYADQTYSRTYAYGETFKYYLLDEAYKQSPDTVYLTVQSDDYCENIPLEAKPVVISQMEAVPALAITPESTEVVIGATPGFTVTPDDARYDLYVNDVKVSSDATTYKPYLDSEYKLVYEGDCGSKTVYANVAVQWPTVFTPYVQDGRNDTFVKDMDPNFYTQIFTRFGTKIYEGDNGWDGSINGSMNGKSPLAVPGVYYYVVQLPDGNVKKGTIEVFKY